MLWIFKFALSVILMFLFIWFGVLNSHIVVLNLFPDFLNFNKFNFLEYPLYIIIIVSILLGFIFGCILENNRSKKIRKSLKLKISELSKSDMEIQKLKKQLNSKKDDILSLLE